MSKRFTTRLKDDNLTIEEMQAVSSIDLREILGANWAICRATVKNKERYANCITPKQYLAAQIASLKRKGLR